MNIALWVLQVLLAFFFLMAGGNKLITPMPELIQQFPWMSEMPELLIRFIGLAEVAGALGLILPAATRIKPILTAFAADGLAIIMALAALFHLTRSEYDAIVINVVLFLLATFVFYGRWKLAPIAPR